MIELPANHIDILNGRSKASDINKALHAAFWVYDSDKDRSLFLLASAHKSFADLADGLGYTVTPKITTESQEIVDAINAATFAGEKRADEVEA